MRWLTLSTPCGTTATAPSGMPSSITNAGPTKRLCNAPRPEPGTNRHGLQATNGKSSADASTGMSRNMLRYKAISRAATLDTPEHLNTQACFACGRIGGPKGTKGLEIRNGLAAIAVRFAIATSMLRGTFSAWEVRRLQKEAPSRPFGVGWRTSPRSRFTAAASGAVACSDRGPLQRCFRRDRRERRAERCSSLAQ
jgi:hypothetical protein